MKHVFPFIFWQDHFSSQLVSPFTWGAWKTHLHNKTSIFASLWSSEVVKSTHSVLVAFQSSEYAEAEKCRVFFKEKNISRSLTPPQKLTKLVLPKKGAKDLDVSKKVPSS